MKKVFTLSVILFMTWSISAQAPQRLSYQCVVRNANGGLVINQTVGLRVSIIQSTPSGTVVFQETYNPKPSTNTNGLLTVEIGSGVASTGTFSSINWAAGPYYLKTETDPAGGSNYTITGTSQLLSVPYALFTAKAANGLNLLATPKSGDILYNNGVDWILLSKGTDGQALKLESGLPKWKPVSDYAAAVPSAVFTVSQLLASTTQTIQVDASGVIDDVDPVSALQVRWRWMDGGTFTTWSTTKTNSYVYTTEGVKNITLEVKDSQGNIGTTSKAITISNSMFMPMVFTSAAANITTTTATCGGNVVTTGGSDVTARGVCWGTSQNPTIANSKTTDGTGIGFFSSSITGLTAGSTYYVRAYATNSTATSYGNQVVVQAALNVVFPTVTTAATTNITANAVTSGGNVTATGGADVTAKGVCWSGNQNPTVADSKTNDGTGTGAFQSQITGLIPGTYYVRAYATNSAGTGYGNMLSFTTEKTLPVLTTKNITDISAMGAVSGGNITSAGGGTISERGICWSDSPNPTITNEKSLSPSTSSSFVAAIAKAGPGTDYYLRAYATNEIGTGYGDQKTFTSSEAAYYTSFETGMTPAGWGGLFTVTSEIAFDGSYSFMSLLNTVSEATFTTTLSSPGQISFYYSLIGGTILHFYIDDEMIVTYQDDGSGWRQGIASLSAGAHVIKWQLSDSDGWWYGGKGYIDQIIITK
jgi:hypothetical protein